jgi:hypothetical protein
MCQCGFERLAVVIAVGFVLRGRVFDQSNAVGR